MPSKIIYIIISIFSIFYIKNYIVSFLGKSENKKIICSLCYLIYSIIISIINLTSNINIINLIGKILAIFIITLNYKSNMRKRIFFTCFFSLFTFLIKLITKLSLIFYLNILELQKLYHYKLLIVVITTMILHSISLVVYKLSNSEIIEKFRIGEWISIILIPSFSLYLMIFFINYKEIITLKEIFIITIILTINIIVFNLYNNLLIILHNYKSKLVDFKYQKDYYYNQCNYMKQTIESTKSFNHDIKNHLLMILGFIKNGKIQEAEQYIYSITRQNLKLKFIYSDSGNIVIDSIINFKFNELKNNNLSIYTDISVPEDLFIEACDITSIIGNLIDNAKEAVNKINNEQCIIDLSIYFDKGRLFITLKNTFDSKLLTNNKKLLSKKIDKHNHGYGLQIIKKIVEKYNGYFQYNYNKNIFTVNIMLYTKKFGNI